MVESMNERIPCGSSNEIRLILLGRTGTGLLFLFVNLIKSKC